MPPTERKSPIPPGKRKRIKRRDPITNSKPYRWLSDQERKGAFKGIGFGSKGQIGEGLGRRLDNAIGPTVDKLKKKMR